MRISTQISTGKFIEMQSDATAGTLIANAVAAGYAEADVQEQVITADEWAAMQASMAAAPDVALARLRTQRDALLTRCDFTQFTDAPSWVDKPAWAAYRQALRDLPANTTDPANPVWPTPPQTMPA